MLASSIGSAVPPIRTAAVTVKELGALRVTATKTVPADSSTVAEAWEKLSVGDGSSSVRFTDKTLGEPRSASAGVPREITMDSVTSSSGSSSRGIERLELIEPAGITQTP